MAQPSYIGYISTPQDAGLVIEACLQGQLPMVGQRVSSSEHDNFIESGHVFVYDHRQTRIQRWTDGHFWSPSRVLDRFLVYREVSAPLPRAAKKAVKGTKPKQELRCEPWETHLYGSLIDSYNFKIEGLVKKTITVKVESTTVSLVAYYRAADVLNCQLSPPTLDSNLSWMEPRPEIQLAVGHRLQGSSNAHLGKPWTGSDARNAKLYITRLANTIRYSPCGLLLGRFVVPWRSAAEHR